jgi:hypothetical protein
VITAIARAVAAIAADTPVPVTKGQRLEVDVFAGSVTVRTWSRDAVKVEGEPGPRDQVEVNVHGSTVEVGTSGKRGPAGAVDLILTVPAGMPIDVSGVELDVNVQNCRCAVHVESVGGDVKVTGTQGTVSLSSVEGDVSLTGATGDVRASSVNADVSLGDVTGDVSAETVNGDVKLTRIRGGNVEASTVNGDMWYDGEIRPNGSYALTSHQGDVSMVVPPSVGATVRVNTFNGSFESDFPVTLQGQAGRSKRLTFTLGGGGAAITLESFSGEIRLLKPGARPSKGSNNDDDD